MVIGLRRNLSVFRLYIRYLLSSWLMFSLRRCAWCGQLRGSLSRRIAGSILLRGDRRLDLSSTICPRCSAEVKARASVYLANQRALQRTEGPGTNERHAMQRRSTSYHSHKAQAIVERST